MIPGAPREARWNRSQPRRDLPAEVLEQIVHRAFPLRRALQAEPLVGGLRNANFKIALDGPPGAVVLRIYEHDPSLCQKEIDIFRLLGGSVPVPEVLHAAPRGLERLPPFVLTRFIEGITFHELKNTGDREAIAQAARSAGETLAAIGRVRFPGGLWQPMPQPLGLSGNETSATAARAGWLGPGLAVGAPLREGRDPLPRFIDLCLAHSLVERRVPADWRTRVHHLAWRCAPQLAALDADPRLVHGDFNRRNLLVQCAAGRWEVAAVLDWEFAVSGSPLADLGSFLRYEKAHAPLAEPHFSDGYRAAGGELPEDWRRLSQLVALASICESLTHEDLPDPVAQELVGLLISHSGAE
jgi:aminoglycoside phosphotransferase (APT) family kinase protein